MPLAEFAQILRCPETQQKLSVASSGLLQQLRDEQVAGRLFHKSGKFAVEAIEAGLVREDGCVLYPVRNEIPVLLGDEAIVIVGGSAAK